MTSIAKEVWKEIESDVVVRRGLEKGIISMKNLAVYLIKKKKIVASLDAVVSAIRRYKEEQPLEKKYETARQMLSQSKEVRITTNIIQIILEKNKETQKLLQKAFERIDYDKGELLLIMQAEQSIKLMLNEKNKEKIIDIFPKKTVIGLEENIAQINITLSDEAVKTPGIMSVLTTEVMMHGVNPVEIMSCVPEVLFFVKQKDVLKCYDVIFGLCSK